MIPKTHIRLFFNASLSGHRYCMFSQQSMQEWGWKLDLAGILWMGSGAHQPSFNRLNEVVHGLFWPWSGRVSSLIVSDGVTGQEAVVMVWPDDCLDGVCWLCGNSQLWLVTGNPAQRQQGRSLQRNLDKLLLCLFFCLTRFFLFCFVLYFTVSHVPATVRPVPSDKWCSQGRSSSVTLPLVGFQTHAGTEWRKAFGLRQWGMRWGGTAETLVDYWGTTGEY